MTKTLPFRPAPEVRVDIGLSSFDLAFPQGPWVLHGQILFQLVLLTGATQVEVRPAMLVVQRQGGQPTVAGAAPQLTLGGGGGGLNGGQPLASRMARRRNSTFGVIGVGRGLNNLNCIN